MKFNFSGMNISSNKTEKEIEEAFNKKVQEIYTELIEQEEAKKYFDAELKFNILIGDVNRIIAEAVKDLI